MASMADVVASLPLPLICAPMTAVSGPELVTAACLAGIAGSFPTRNARSVSELDEWLTAIQDSRRTASAAGKRVGPLSANLVMRGNQRLADEIELLGRHNVDFVITSVGSPKEVVGPLHERSVSVIADVASMRHAELALEAGVDGLVLLTAGAGGHTGWANGFAFVRAIRAEYSGPVVMAGGISDGAALWAAVVLGCELGYMGTRFIAASESRAGDSYKQALVSSSLDDIELGVAPNGIAASSIRGGAGSAGHTVSGVRGIQSVAEIVEETRLEWNAAIAATAARSVGAAV